MLPIGKPQPLLRRPRPQTDIATLFDDVAETGFGRGLEARALPPLRFLIFFTPRSGSGHLVTLLGNALAIPKPGEFFNVNVMQPQIRRLGARDAESYARRHARLRRYAQGFGGKVVISQLEKFFDDPARLFDIIAPTHLIWLIRRDVVARAVSMSKLRQTAVPHSTHGPEAVAEAEAGFSYDRRLIRNLIQRFANVESDTERLLAERGQPVLRLVYEDMIAAGNEATTARVLGHLGREQKAPASGLERISGSRSAEAIARFRAEEPDFLAGIELARAPLLARFNEG